MGVRLRKEFHASDPYEELQGIVNVNRAAWIDLVTCYQAIFESRGISIDPLLGKWISSCIKEFLDTLQKLLPLFSDDFSQIASILEQCMGLAGTLERYGADFQTPTAAYFEKHVSALMVDRWSDTVSDFEETLNLNVAEDAIGAPIVIPSATRDNLDENFVFTIESVSVPPKLFMSFPILAEIVNSYLEGFNELRRCAIASLQVQLAEGLMHSFVTIVEVISRFCQENELRIEEESSHTVAKKGAKMSLEKQVFLMCKVLSKVMFPYLVQAFRAVYNLSSGLEQILDHNRLQVLLKQKKLITS